MNSGWIKWIIGREPGLCRHLQAEGHCDMCEYEKRHDGGGELIHGRFREGAA